MLDLDKGSEQLDKADGFLTKLKTLIKKHWGILLIIGLVTGAYFLFTIDPNEEGQYEEPYNDEYYDENIPLEDDSVSQDEI